MGNGEKVIMKKVSIFNFMRYNKEKKLTLEVWIWMAIFRMLILFVPQKYLKKHYGKSGEESSETENEANYQQAQKIAINVNRISIKTPWESKCLVRALTAQRLLNKRKIESTMYLGVRKEDNKMVAHAWLRVGKFYLTGGDGKEYTTVAFFKK